MSLDVYLIGGTKKVECRCSNCGNVHTSVEVEYLYNSNITHNLNHMAEEAGIYNALWRPYRLKEEYDEALEESYDKELEFESNQIIKAKELIPFLEKGLADLKARPEYFKKFDASNGWGTYEHFIPFVEEYLEACKMYPEASVEVSR